MKSRAGRPTREPSKQTLIADASEKLKWEPGYPQGRKGGKGKSLSGMGESGKVGLWGGGLLYTGERSTAHVRVGSEAEAVARLSARPNAICMQPCVPEDVFFPLCPSHKPTCPNRRLAAPDNAVLQGHG